MSILIFADPICSIIILNSVVFMLSEASVSTCSTTGYFSTHDDDSSSTHPPGHCTEPLDPSLTPDTQTISRLFNFSLRRSHNYQRTDKPPYAYVGLIALAIQSSPEKRLALGEVNAALTQMFEYFRDVKYRKWRDSVRHNLSSHSCFSRVFPDSSKRNAKWVVDLDLIPSHAFLLQENANSKKGNWAPTLHQQLNVSPVIPVVTSSRRLRTSVHPSDTTESRKRKKTTVSKKVKKTKLDDEKFSTRNYSQLQTIMSDTSLPFGVNVDVAMTNLVDLCHSTDTSATTGVSSPSSHDRETDTAPKINHHDYKIPSMECPTTPPPSAVQYLIPASRYNTPYTPYHHMNHNYHENDSCNFTSGKDSSQNPFYTHHASDHAEIQGPISEEVYDSTSTPSTSRVFYDSTGTPSTSRVFYDNPSRNAADNLYSDISVDSSTEFVFSDSFLSRSHSDTSGCSRFSLDDFIHVYVNQGNPL